MSEKEIVQLIEKAESLRGLYDLLTKVTLCLCGSFLGLMAARSFNQIIVCELLSATFISPFALIFMRHCIVNKLDQLDSQIIKNYEREGRSR